MSAHFARGKLVQTLRIADAEGKKRRILCNVRVYLTNGASLSGFTLTDGRAHLGGGLWCESADTVVSNCVVSGNSSFGHTISVGVGTPCCGLQDPVPSAGG